MQAAYGATTQVHTGLEVLNRSLVGAQYGSGRMGMALMQLGYIADDIQYSFSAIVNNIAPLTLNFAMAAGASAAMGASIAAGAQIAGVAIYQLVVHWDQLMDAMGMGTVRSEADEMEYLASKTSKTADEQKRLNDLKRESAEIDKMMAGKSELEAKSESATQTAFNEADPEKILKGIAETLVSQGKGARLTPEEEANIRDPHPIASAAGGLVPFGKSVVDSLLKPSDAQADATIQGKNDAENIRRAKDLMRRAKSGKDPSARQELESLVNANPGAFPKGFLDQLKNAEGGKTNKDIEHEESQSIDEADREFEASNRAWESYLKRRQRWIDAQAKELAKSSLGMSAIAGSLTDAQVADQMKASGVNAGRVAGTAEDVAKALRKDAEDRIQANASAKGLTRDQSIADLQAQDRERRKHEAEQRQRKLAAQAEETLPGVGDAAERGLIAGAAARGGGPGAAADVKAAIVAKLKAMGVDPQAANEQADAVLGGAKKKANDKIANAGMENEEEQQPREKEKHNEVFNASDLAARIQNSVGAEQDVPKKQLDVAQQQLKFLAMIANMKGIPLRFN